MTQIDEFESLFKAADKPVFHVEPIRLQRVLIVLDENTRDPDLFVRQLRAFLRPLEGGDQPLEFGQITGEQYATVSDLLGRVEAFRPDLICTYRNLHIPTTEHPYSLGVYVDVLTQATLTPILLLPRPDAEGNVSSRGESPQQVMAVTDHLAGDRQLVSYASRFTAAGGTLSLVHVEDQVTFERYMEVISRIPAIDTSTARDEIAAQLLKEPADYIESCRREIARLALPIEVRPVVTMGRCLPDYRRLVDEFQADLLVIHTKDDDQLAMHGMGYPLSIEIQDIPLLMI